MLPIVIRRLRHWSFGRLFATAISGRLGLLLALGVVGCGHASVIDPEPPSRASQLLAPASRPLRPEVLRASVQVLGLEIATLESASCAVPSGGTRFETEVEAAPLVTLVRRTSGEARTELMGPAAAPRSSDYTFRDGEVVRHYQVEYRPGGYAYAYDNGGPARRTGAWVVPGGAEPHDLHSSLVLLRAWRPRLGETGYFYVVLGRRPWRVDVTSRGLEMVRVGDDARLTYRIDGLAVRLDEGPGAVRSKRFSLWLSEDAQRVPLRMVADASFGPVTMTLTGHERAERQCSEAVALRRAASPRRASPPMPLAPSSARIGSAWHGGTR